MRGALKSLREVKASLGMNNGPGISSMDGKMWRPGDIDDMSSELGN